MYRIYIFGGNSKNNLSELYTDLNEVENLCREHRENGFIVRVYWQSQNEKGDIVERLIEDIQ